MLVQSHDIFAAKGDPWDARARREQKPTGLIVTRIEGPNWVELRHRWRNEGFGPDGVEPEQARARKGDPSRVAPLPLARVPREGERRSLPAEGLHYHRKEELRGKPVSLSEEQLAKRKRQQASIKARITRAQNRLAREREEVLNIILGL